jgi:hypothetical protein
LGLVAYCRTSCVGLTVAFTRIPTSNREEDWQVGQADITYVIQPLARRALNYNPLDIDAFPLLSHHLEDTCSRVIKSGLSGWTALIVQKGKRRGSESPAFSVFTVLMISRFAFTACTLAFIKAILGLCSNLRLQSSCAIVKKKHSQA